jgi:hypothetical protein
MKELPTVPQPRTPIRTVKWSLLDMGFTVPGAIDLVPVKLISACRRAYFASQYLNEVSPLASLHALQAELRRC